MNDNAVICFFKLCCPSCVLTLDISLWMSYGHFRPKRVPSPSPERSHFPFQIITFSSISFLSELLSKGPSQKSVTVPVLIPPLFAVSSLLASYCSHLVLGSHSWLGLLQWALVWFSPHHLILHLELPELPF